jgi:hypothetical protein
MYVLCSLFIGVFCTVLESGLGAIFAKVPLATVLYFELFTPWNALCYIPTIFSATILLKSFARNSRHTVGGGVKCERYKLKLKQEIRFIEENVF